MSWEFIHIVRRTYQGDDNWGEMFIQTVKGAWERLCYTYELPWDVYVSGPLSGKSKNNISRIKIGTYDLKPRSNGPKGWRLELQNTGHRTNIQIHRSHSSMFIQGCILPVNFNNLSASKLKKGDPSIQTQSIALMNKIKNRYDKMKSKKKDNPSLTIAARLPALHIMPRSSMYA